MVLCAMVIDLSETRESRLPAIISHQGDKTREFSKRRKDEWLARIKREDINPEKLQYVRLSFCVRSTS